MFKVTHHLFMACKIPMLVTVQKIQMALLRESHCITARINIFYNQIIIEYLIRTTPLIVDHQAITLKIYKS